MDDRTEDALRQSHKGYESTTHDQHRGYRVRCTAAGLLYVAEETARGVVKEVERGRTVGRKRAKRLWRRRMTQGVDVVCGLEDGVMFSVENPGLHVHDTSACLTLAVVCR